MITSHENREYRNQNILGPWITCKLTDQLSVNLTLHKLSYRILSYRIVSYRSIGTCRSLLADIAVAISVPLWKVGKILDPEYLSNSLQCLCILLLALNVFHSLLRRSDQFNRLTEKRKRNESITNFCLAPNSLIE